MARIRTVKPEFFLHEDLFDLEESTGLPVRLAFQGLWCQCDREGRFRWRPRSLKAQILPFDQVDFEAILSALVAGGFVVKYATITRDSRVPDASTTRESRVNGDVFGCVPGFIRHQVINNRESASILPGPDDEGVEILGGETTSTRAARVADASDTRGRSQKEEGKGREGKGKEGKEDPGGTPGRSKVTIDDVAFPDGMDGGDVRQAMTDWLQHHRAIGKPYKSAAAVSKLLERFLGRPVDFVAAVAYSIGNNYQGLVEEKGSSNGKKIEIERRHEHRPGQQSAGHGKW